MIDHWISSARVAGQRAGMLLGCWTPFSFLSPEEHKNSHPMGIPEVFLASDTPWTHKTASLCSCPACKGEFNRDLRQQGASGEGTRVSVPGRVLQHTAQIQDSLWNIFLPQVLTPLEQAGHGHRQAYSTGSCRQCQVDSCLTQHLREQHGLWGRVCSEQQRGAEQQCCAAVPACCMRLDSFSREVAAPSAAVPVHLFPAFDENSAAWLDWIWAWTRTSFFLHPFSIWNWAFKHSYLARSQKTKYCGLSY